MTGPRRVLLGRFAGAHGLKGEIVVHSFTEVPEDIAAYGPLADAEGGRSFTLKVVRAGEKGVVVRVSGVADRTAAEALKGIELWVDRERLPEADEGEYYHADLIGLDAVAPDGTRIGTIVAVQNYGAGDLIEIRLDGTRRTELVPFADAYVPEIDMTASRAVVRMPEAAPDDADDEAPDGGAPEDDEGGGAGSGGDEPPSGIQR